MKSLLLGLICLLPLNAYAVEYAVQSENELHRSVNPSSEAVELMIIQLK
jgi:hypothetical protein